MECDAPGADIRRLRDVPIEVTVEIGRSRATIGKTLDLRPGALVPLAKLASEPVEVRVAHKVIALGEAIVIDEEFGVRITDMVGGVGEPIDQQRGDPAFREREAALEALAALTPTAR